MYRLEYNAEKKKVTVVDNSGPESRYFTYKDAEAKFFYPEQIIEIHSGEKFVAILPIGMTLVIFE